MGPTTKNICSAQSENLHNFEIVLCILRILRLPSNLKIVHYICMISRLRNYSCMISRLRNYGCLISRCASIVRSLRGQLYSCKTPCRYTKTTSYCSAQNVSKTFCWFFSLSLTLRDRNIPSMHADGAYQGCLSSCKLRSRALTVSRTGKVESSHIDIQIAHVSHAILRLYILCEIAQRLSYVSQTECR